jgi:hypothetical protein
MRLTGLSSAFSQSFREIPCTFASVIVGVAVAEFSNRIRAVVTASLGRATALIRLLEGNMQGLEPGQLIAFHVRVDGSVTRFVGRIQRIYKDNRFTAVCKVGSEYQYLRFEGNCILGAIQVLNDGAIKIRQTNKDEIAATPTVRINRRYVIVPFSVVGYPKQPLPELFDTFRDWIR